MPRTLLIVAALAVLIAAAVFEGTRSNRWGASEDLKTAAEKLNRVPTAFGAWSSTDNPVDSRILEKAEAIGSISRTYENQADRSRISVLLLCGRSGPIGAHTPDVCYAGIGYRMAGGELKKTIGDSTYWTARFEKPDGPNMMVSWAWSLDGTWRAAEQPRVEYVGHDVLYKLYATRSLTPAEQANAPAGSDPTIVFLNEFLPQVKKALEPNSLK